MNLTITPKFNFNSQNIQSKPSQFTKMSQKPSYDTVSFGRSVTPDLISFRPEKIKTVIEKLETITNINKLKEHPIIQEIRNNDQIQELAKFVGVPLRRMGESSFVSKKAHSLSEIETITKKSKNEINEELINLKRFKTKDQLGEFVDAAYKYNLKSDLRPDAFTSFEINGYWFNNVMNEFDNEAKSLVKVPFKVSTLSWRDCGRTGINDEFISPAMQKIIKSKLYTQKFAWHEQTFPVSYNGQNYLVSSGNSITKLPEGYVFKPKSEVFR